VSELRDGVGRGIAFGKDDVCAMESVGARGQQAHDNHGNFRESDVSAVATFVAGVDRGGEGSQVRRRKPFKRESCVRRLVCDGQFARPEELSPSASTPAATSLMNTQVESCCRRAVERACNSGDPEARCRGRRDHRGSYAGCSPVVGVPVSFAIGPT